MDQEKNKKNGGIPTRMGMKFHGEIEEIKYQRKKTGSSRVSPSTEKITNLIIRHKLWPDIKKDIILASEKEVTLYGL